MITGIGQGKGMGGSIHITNFIADYYHVGEDFPGYSRLLDVKDPEMRFDDLMTAAKNIDPGDPAKKEKFWKQTKKQIDNVLARSAEGKTKIESVFVTDNNRNITIFASDERNVIKIDKEEEKPITEPFTEIIKTLCGQEEDLYKGISKYVDISRNVDRSKNRISIGNEKSDRLPWYSIEKHDTESGPVYSFCEQQPDRSGWEYPFDLYRRVDLRVTNSEFFDNLWKSRDAAAKIPEIIKTAFRRVSEGKAEPRAFLVAAKRLYCTENMAFHYEMRISKVFGGDLLVAGVNEGPKDPYASYEQLRIYKDVGEEVDSGNIDDICIKQMFKPDLNLDGINAVYTESLKRKWEGEKENRKKTEKRTEYKGFTR